MAKHRATPSRPSWIPRRTRDKLYERSFSRCGGCGEDVYVLAVDCRGCGAEVVQRAS